MLLLFFENKTVQWGFHNLIDQTNLKINRCPALTLPAIIHYICIKLKKISYVFIGCR